MKRFFKALIAGVLALTLTAPAWASITPKPPYYKLGTRGCQLYWFGIKGKAGLYWCWLTDCAGFCILICEDHSGIFSDGKHSCECWMYTSTKILPGGTFGPMDLDSTRYERGDRLGIFSASFPSHTLTTPGDPKGPLDMASVTVSNLNVNSNIYTTRFGTMDPNKTYIELTDMSFNVTLTSPDGSQRVIENPARRVNAHFKTSGEPTSYLAYDNQMIPANVAELNNDGTFTVTMVFDLPKEPNSLRDTAIFMKASGKITDSTMTWSYSDFKLLQK